MGLNRWYIEVRSHCASSYLRMIFHRLVCRHLHLRSLDSIRSNIYSHRLGGGWVSSSEGTSRQ